MAALTPALLDIRVTRCGIRAVPGLVVTKPSVTEAINSSPEATRATRRIPISLEPATPSLSPGSIREPVLDGTRNTRTDQRSAREGVEGVVLAGTGAGPCPPHRRQDGDGDLGERRWRRGRARMSQKAIKSDARETRRRWLRGSWKFHRTRPPIHGGMSPVLGLGHGSSMHCIPRRETPDERIHRAVWRTSGP